ncbi:phosphoenolpyruvate carboxykinase (GTP) [Aeromicrobium marinum DSM 15272]|uniref:Phosphoenolpyruvate carboxykinase [GTP] n=1 Tax=Aeromicrobium marinum DSM 15272 TaxID=585531 RepID=E2S8D0_9ACTN|nr:phosphoenolpyruvate carboxykinase (GTP) [Aeromicrobium marinum]EFQ84435.1 phosphoenolpyruvate carboxykinase (GTP) [Aeromicrobium marinum DSM 15272]
MADVDAALDAAGLTNPHVREYVKYWAGITGAERVEVVGADDDARLVQEALDAGELQPVTGGRTYSRSYIKDTARAEERTIVATSDESDKGLYNNWQPSDQAKENYLSLVQGASEGKTMYVVPYLMAPQGSPLEKFAAGVEITDARTVVLHMIRMARVGVNYINELAEPDHFVRAVHVTGDLPNLGQGTPDDKRYFYTIADERTILHFGSSYGGNALLGKIAHGLRLASYDGWKNGFLVEQFLLLGVKDKQTGEVHNIVGGFPSASGKTNLSMTLAPDTLGDRYEIEFYGDDIAWLWPGEDGRLYAFNPEFGVFGVARDTNEKSNPTAIDAIQPGTGTIFTNVAYNEKTQEVWWEGKTKEHPTDLDGWLDWKGERIADRSPETADEAWAHPNSRFTTTMANVPNLAEGYANPAGVPVDAIIFGGRTRDREPLIRSFTDVAEGVYDGLTLGAEATFAADGLEGVLRYDPMSMRPFMSYGEGDYAQHWLDVLGKTTEKPIFAHVNWFQRDPEDGHFLWPGFRENVRALVWLIESKNGLVKGNPTPVGMIPTKDELLLEGLEIEPGDLDTLLTIDIERWKQEIGYREEHLKQFVGLPEEIWEAHRRVAADIDAAGS